MLSIAAILLVSARSALGVPAFARKYGTSCLTCHTIYPKLNPFGEAFRRNGYRFPGVDSDFVKQNTVSLGQDAYKKEFPHFVWPGTLPGSVPLALGFNGQAVIHPNRNSGGAAADNGARVNLNDLISEGHIWAGGSFDDQITFFGELTFASGTSEIEHVGVYFNDLVGAPHDLNLVVGKQRHDQRTPRLRGRRQRGRQRRGEISRGLLRPRRVQIRRDAARRREGEFRPRREQAVGGEVPHAADVLLSVGFAVLRLRQHDPG
ncbi:MAG: hypothetical protein B7Z61_08900 [Acidobacteria bacterium 37-71-11]|nr:MAG: hypothetical protein B7Z61_08900 [Acidobacteria bacterium 37-71-11]